MRTSRPIRNAANAHSGRYRILSNVYLLWVAWVLFGAYKPLPVRLAAVRGQGFEGTIVKRFFPRGTQIPQYLPRDTPIKLILTSCATWYNVIVPGSAGSKYGVGPVFKTGPAFCQGESALTVIG